jgi:hypothetical protein
MIKLPRRWNIFAIESPVNEVFNPVTRTLDF